MINYFAQYLDGLRNEIFDENFELVIDVEWDDAKTEFPLWQIAEDPNMFAGDYFTLQQNIPYTVQTALNEKRCWIAGGFVRRWINEEEQKASDIDLFFDTFENKEVVREMFIADRWEKTFECPQGLLTTFSMDLGDAPSIKVQLVSKAYYPSMEACIDTFDFTVSMFALNNEKIVCGERSLRDLYDRVLYLHSLPYPLATMRRFIKYSRSGFKFTEETGVNFIQAVVSATQSMNADGMMQLTGGTFMDDRPARIEQDGLSVWYVD